MCDRRHAQGGLPEPSVRLDERAQDFAARMHAAAQAKRKAMDPSPGPQVSPGPALHCPALGGHAMLKP